MLISAIAYLKAQGKEWRNVAVYGQEINALTSAIGKMNLFLHGVKDFSIINGDTLAAPAFIEHGKLQQFDLVLANPPYSISQWDRAAFESDKYGRNFLGVPPQGRAEYAFLQHIIASLKKDTRRCAILFPHGVLFRNEESAMRERLIRSDAVECVIGLGPNLFYNSPMEACIMICRMTKQPERRGQVLFINAVNEVERKNAQPPQYSPKWTCYVWKVEVISDTNKGGDALKRIVEKRYIGGPKQPKLLRVAAYARVSSGKDEMLHSLSAQISHYSETIQNHSGWLYAGVYSDEAKTGTKETRPGFQRLLADCRAGKIDLVLVKSISRLARNTVTLLETVRELRSLGIDVYFEEQNIHTTSYEGELMLTILASYAQEEALSVSENQKWRVKKNFREGRPWNSTVLGYRNVNGTFVIVPEEAAIVKRIFAMYLDGMGVQLIANTLNAEGIRTRFGGEFNHSGMQKILRNYAYTGNLLLQKTFREDCLTKKDHINRGERPKYHATGTHEPIISMEDFERVQAEFARRAEAFHSEYQPDRYPFTSLITCAICGKHFIRKHTRTGPTWICGTLKQKGKSACPSKQIPEATLLKITADMDMSRITGITADNGNRLKFYLDDGTVIEKQWLDRSRSESGPTRCGRRPENIRKRGIRNVRKKRNGHPGDDKPDPADEPDNKKAPCGRVCPGIHRQR